MAINGVLNFKDKNGDITTVYPVTSAENVAGLSAALAGKVDKEAGKGLSANDYTTTEKEKLAGIEAGANAYTLPAATSSTLGGVKQGANITIAADGTISTANYTLPKATTASLGGIQVGTDLNIDSSTGSLSVNKTSSVTSGSGELVTSGGVYAALENKVDKVSGKGLSSNDYTDNDKNKLSGIEAGAEVNVQADWNQTTSTADDYIRNKPTLGTAAAASASDFATAAQGTKADNAIPSSAKGTANGVAELDSNGLVPASQLPSFVDDVLEYASSSGFPVPGESGKIYVAIDTNLTYRWSGSAYVEISPSLALGTTESTAYRGDRGQTAYEHATDASRLTTAKTSGLYKIATTAEGHVSSATPATKSDITALGIPAQDTTYSEATTSTSGLMSASDKSKLNGIEDELETKADTTTVIAMQTAINTALASKADKSTVTALAETVSGKANTSDVNTALAGKADVATVTSLSERVTQAETDIDTQTARIDAIAALPSGSTSGDAELMDIRVKADGTTATNAGAAVREQVKSLDYNISKVCSKNLVGMDTDVYYPVDIKSGDTVVASSPQGGFPSGMLLYAYDANKQEIDYWSLWAARTITFDTDVKYFRINKPHPTQIEKGSNATAYQPYYDLKEQMDEAQNVLYSGLNTGTAKALFEYGVQSAAVGEKVTFGKGYQVRAYSGRLYLKSGDIIRCLDNSLRVQVIKVDESDIILEDDNIWGTSITISSDGLYYLYIKTESDSDITLSNDMVSYPFNGVLTFKHGASNPIVGEVISFDDRTIRAHSDILYLEKGTIIYSVNKKNYFARVKLSSDNVVLSDPDNWEHTDNVIEESGYYVLYVKDPVQTNVDINTVDFELTTQSVASAIADYKSNDKLRVIRATETIEYHGCKTVAHTGYLTGNYPRNSREGFLESAKSDVWGIETDLQTTSDGVIVCLHDPYHGRLTSGSGVVNELTWAYQYENIRLSYDYEGTPSEYRICTFEEYLRICKVYNKVPIIDLKVHSEQYQGRTIYVNHDYDKIVKLLRKYGLEHKAIFTAMYEPFLDGIRNISDKACCLYDTYNYVSPEYILSHKYGKNHNAGVSIYFTADLNQDKINQYHEEGLIFIIWTASPTAKTQTKQLCEMGADIAVCDEIEDILAE